MLWWKRPRRGKDKDPESELRERLGKLEHEHQELLAEMKRVAMDWEDYYNKFRSLYGRLNKRAQREEAPEPAQTARPVNPAAQRLLNPYMGMNGK